LDYVYVLHIPAGHLFIPKNQACSWSIWDEGLIWHCFLKVPHLTRWSLQRISSA